MTGDQWTARLSDYVDDETAPAEREALERHLAECAVCEQAVAELRRVTLRAGALAERAPQRDLWPGIAARIGLGTVAPFPARLIARRRAFTLTLSQLAAAAGVLLAVGAGTMWLAVGARGGSTLPTRGATPIAAGPSLGPAPAGAQQFAGSGAYEIAAADLRRVLDANRSRLDTSTVRVIEESLRTIDRAITRAQAALAADPSDAYLNAHLAETMRRKLELLQRAALLATRAS
jgi:anti-sigma factor RsiW